MDNILSEKRKFYHSLVFPGLFLISIWLIKLFEITLNTGFSKLGIYPLKIFGLPGIVLSPFLHGDLKHLISNSVPVFILWVAIIYFYRGIGHRVVIISWLMTGIFVWLIGRPSFHIGASGLVYAFAAFLFFSGVLRQDNRLLAIALAVAFMYGSMIWGIFPQDPKISFEAHAMGLFSGLALAIYYRKEGPKRKKYSWEIEEEEERKEEEKRELTPGPTDYSSENIEIKYIWKEKE
ncbi:MAG: rhomboid family intramembrane serine protease [Bacteroidota bacterium]|nr:rhomboid family intramembrane serine protease [Bacteroidota bacterium]